MASTNFTNAVTLTDAEWFDDTDTLIYGSLSSVAGTNTITASGPTSLTAYSSGQVFRFVPAATNTGATTINVSSLGAKNIFCGGAACVGGEIRISVPCVIQYDGTQFNIIGPYVGGNLPTGQIKFPATQNASSDVNTLDDYEEGTWTPVLTFATAGDLSVAYTTQVGSYTKIGRLVIVSGNIVASTFTHTTASGNLQVTGLPFTPLNTAGLSHFGGCSWNGITKANYSAVAAWVADNSTIVTFAISGSGQAVNTVQSGDMPSGGAPHLRFTVAYHV